MDCETYPTESSLHDVFFAMRDLYYIDTVVDTEPELPSWLDGQLKRWFNEIVNEPLPEQLQRLLREFDEDARLR